MTVNILENFCKEAEFAQINGLVRRSAQRYREQGLPWMRWGREIWIGPRDEARAWLLARVHRNPARRTEKSKT